MLLPNYYGSVDKTAGEVVHHIFLKSLMRFFLNLTAWLFALYIFFFSYSNLDLLCIKVLKTGLKLIISVKVCDRTV